MHLAKQQRRKEREFVLTTPNHFAPLHLCARILCLLPLAVATVSAQWQSIGNVDSYVTANGNECVLRAGKAVVQIRVLAPDLVRVRCFPPTMHVAPDHLPPSSSWAVAKTDWVLTPIEFKDSPSSLVLTTAALRVVAAKKPLRITFTTLDGAVINADHPSKGMAWALPTAGAPKVGTEIRVWKSMPEDELYYGFGERSGAFMRKSTHMTNWNSDIPAYAADTDPLYQSIPFFYGLREGKSYGIFFDNTYRASFDMGKESRDQYSFGAENGELDYYFFYGPAPSTVLARFTELVGRMPLPPLWSLGYQQCRWSYPTETRVREIARGFRDRKIPCDVIYLDIDYMDGYRVFTWNSTAFPNPAGMITDLGKDGFKVAVIIDPGVKVDSAYTAYRTGLAGDHFLKYPDGKIFIGDVWPGRCAFPDFTSDVTRTWWGDQFKPLVEAGIKGWWNDMNEPSVFNTPTKTVVLEVVHNDAGQHTTHAKNHNIYGMQMTRATYDGVIRHNPGIRPFILTRASFAGGHQYAAAWTGDNVSSWEHLRMALSMCLNMSISGQPFVGSDIGGFIGYPSGELFTRWLQLGVFTPLMRAHSVINEKNKEPWEFGDSYTAANREAINLRYSLLPYVYSVMAEAAATGIPAMRPMMFAYPDDHRFSNEASQFMFGNDLIVAPILWEGAVRRDVQLPAGKWVSFWTHEVVEGGRQVSADAPLSTIPVFVRAGAVIPSQKPLQFVGQFPLDTLTLTVYPAPARHRSSSFYYEDDGVSFSYRSGKYLRRRIEHSRDSLRESIVLPAPEGSYGNPERSLILRLVGARVPLTRITLNGELLPQAASWTSTHIGWSQAVETGIIEVRIHDLHTPQRVDIEYEH
jgi:alpha-glucosidase